MRGIELEFQKNQATLDLKVRITINYFKLLVYIQVPMVQMIYDKLDHANSSVVQCCCNVLFTGAERGWIQFTGFVNGLLNIMPTTR